MTNDLSAMDNELDQLASLEAKRRRHLTALLDEVSRVQNKYISTRGEMGKHEGLQGRWHRTPSYVVSHDLAWIGTNIEMGSDMPFIKNKVKDGKLEIDHENIDEIQQRMPDWSRQAELTAYLAHNKHRKFGTVLAVVSPGWINDPGHENWSSDGRALKGAITFEPLDSADRIGLIQLDRSQVSIYALDGQHRLMGIKGLVDLQGNRLHLKNKVGKNLQIFPREDFFREIGLDDVELQSLLGERLHVEYVPAILPGETRAEAVRRIRSVFYALNAYAKKPSKGETLLLSETDGYAIVARRVGVTHPLLRSARGNRDRVNWGGSALPDGSEWYTTLEALKEMVHGAMSGMRPELRPAFDKKLGSRVELRPDDDQLDEASEMFAEFLTHVHQLPVFQEIERSEDPAKELVRQRTFSDDGKGHLLLRPIGQQILADAVGELLRQGMDIKDVFAALAELDRNGRFEAHRPQNVWYGVTYDFHNKKMDTDLSHRRLAVELLVYLVRGANEDKRKELESRLLPMRVVDEEAHEWRGFKGEIAKYSIESSSDGTRALSSKAMMLPVPRS
ncbi:MAG: DGQHR domain-containing protein [Piscinibacter sp.]